MVVQRLRLVVSKEPSRAGVSLPSPEDGSSFQNVIFSSYLEFQMMDKVHNPADSGYYTPSSGLFRFQRCEAIPVPGCGSP
jgi:hypothetical protein